MVLVDGTASFVARSSTDTARSVTERLGVEPTLIREVGDLVGNGRSGRRHSQAIWQIDRHFGAAQEPFDAALASLLGQLDGQAQALNALRPAFDLEIRCYRSSDSSQGGFWLSADVMRRLGGLGIDFFAPSTSIAPTRTTPKGNPASARPRTGPFIRYAALRAFTVNTQRPQSACCDRPHQDLARSDHT